MSECVVVRSFLPWVEICRWHAKRIESRCPCGDLVIYHSLLALLFLLCDSFFFFFSIRACRPSLNSESITHLVTPVSLSSSLRPSVSLSAFELLSCTVLLKQRTEEHAGEFDFRWPASLFFSLGILVVQIFVLF